MKLKNLSGADLFCGGGGTSNALLDACRDSGYALELTAVNHWQIAVTTHSANHPTSRHLCSNLDNINPRQLFGEGKLGVMWASPECTNHSIASGGRPVNDQSRATAMCVVRWAEALRPPVILVENVREFLDWGPTIRVRRPATSFQRGPDGFPVSNRKSKIKNQKFPAHVIMPDPKRKGEIFRAWKAMLEAIGYRVEWRILNAADFGDPTSRRRLIVQAVLGRRKCVWPNPTHAPADIAASLKLQPWRAAREIIDWNLTGHSIFTRNKPLAPKTMRRILVGLQRFGLAPFVIGQQSGAAPRSVDDPMPTVASAGAISSIHPYIVGAGGPDRAGEASSVQKPLRTVLARNTKALVQPFIIPNFGENGTQTPRSHSVDEPLPSVTSHGAGALVQPQPFIVTMKGKSNGASVHKPMPTLTGGKNQMLAQPKAFIVKMRGTNHAADVENPTPTVTASGNHLGMAQPYLTQTNHGLKQGKDPKSRVRSVKEPMPTVVAGHRGEWSVRAVCGSIDHRGSNGHCAANVNKPLSGITTKNRHALCDPFVVRFYGASTASSVNAPLGTVTTKDRFGLCEPKIFEVDGRKGWLVEINGQRYLVDVMFRMFTWRELANAQSFPKDYYFAGTDTEKVRQIGNAVPYWLAYACVTSALTQNPNWKRPQPKRKSHARKN